MMRFEPETAGWEAQTLPLCYAIPPNLQVVFIFNRLMPPEFQDVKPFCVAKGMGKGDVGYQIKRVIVFIEFEISSEAFNPGLNEKLY